MLNHHLGDPAGTRGEPSGALRGALLGFLRLPGAVGACLRLPGRLLAREP
ncbi:hypothetical protein LRQ04_01220 [Paenarthrobacter sp. AR 02]|nr:hypothetical protein [Paenarthrobacter sp. AR 02]MCF3137861.1 hypothetical protein [Paenarthrobacter sp. AR 02]